MTMVKMPVVVDVLETTMTVFAFYYFSNVQSFVLRRKCLTRIPGYFIAVVLNALEIYGRKPEVAQVIMRSTLSDQVVLVSLLKTVKIRWSFSTKFSKTKSLRVLITFLRRRPECGRIIMLRKRCEECYVTKELETGKVLCSCSEDKVHHRDWIKQ